MLGTAGLAPVAMTALLNFNLLPSTVRESGPVKQARPWNVNTGFHCISVVLRQISRFAWSLAGNLSASLPAGMEQQNSKTVWREFLLPREAVAAIAGSS